MKKIAILGIGAMGGFIAAKLAETRQYELHLLSRSNFQVLANSGLTLVKKQSEINFPPDHFAIYNDSKRMPACDIVIICVNTSQNSDLLKNINNIIHPDTQLITLQNGIDFEGDIQSIYPNNDVYTTRH